VQCLRQGSLNLTRAYQVLTGVPVGGCRWVGAGGWVGLGADVGTARESRWRSSAYLHVWLEGQLGGPGGVVWPPSQVA
jgi:hypothetical protein